MPPTAPVEISPDTIEQYRRELTGYCYRMLGSGFEADDAVQETMLRAWRAADGFEGRSSVRSWLYRIATNICLDMLRGRQRRALPMDLGPASPPVEALLGDWNPDDIWISPIADDKVVPEHGDPADIAVARDTIRLAFVTALQHLPARQRATLIMCEVLRMPAAEAAATLGTSVAAVNSALQRARATLAALPEEQRPTSVDSDQAELLAKYVDAFQRYDMEQLVTLLHDDALMTMPPYAMWVRGRRERLPLDDPADAEPVRGLDPGTDRPGQRRPGVGAVQAGPGRRPPAVGAAGARGVRRPDQPLDVLPGDRADFPRVRAAAAPKLNQVSTDTPGLSGVGQPGFVARYGLASAERQAMAEEVAARIRDHGLRTVRLAVVDQHGVPRGKMLSPDAAIAAMSDGLDFSGAIYSLDTGNQVFVPAFARGGGFGIAEFTGFPDVVVVPDPATFRVLPWADRTGWMLCDVYFGNGQPMPLDGRGLLRRMLSDLAAAGYDYLAGIEVEFSVVIRSPEQLAPENAGFTPPPPPVSVFERGYQFLSEVRLDGMGDTLEAIRDALFDVGLPLRSIEDEWGPGQLEFSFAPIAGLAAADAAVLFRSTVKQVCQRRGLLATFMCRPALPNFFSSGWHLHQSLLSRVNGSNAFASGSAPLSALGRQYVAGLLEHTMPMTVFAAPTVNGYKRFRPYSFAPDRVCWAIENRGALVRVQGSPGDTSSHVEMRLGEPAANPYFYMASNIAAGLDGIRRGAEPPPPAEADPYAIEAPPLPASLAEAVDALDGDPFYRKAFGDTLVSYLVMMKRFEIGRYQDALAELPMPDGQDVSDWEMREYFEFF